MHAQPLVLHVFTCPVGYVSALMEPCSGFTLPPRPVMLWPDAAELLFPCQYDPKLPVCPAQEICTTDSERSLASFCAGSLNCRWPQELTLGLLLLSVQKRQDWTRLRDMPAVHQQTRYGNAHAHIHTLTFILGNHFSRLQVLLCEGLYWRRL